MQKTLVIMLVVVVLALVGVIVFQKLNQPEPTPLVINQPIVNQPAVNQPVANQPSTNCVKEGEHIEGKTDGTSYNGSCCAGLVLVMDSEWRSDLNECKIGAQGGLAGYTCAYCGNGVCGPGENQCNCPADCKASETAGYKKHINTYAGYSVSYPNDWIIDSPKIYEDTGSQIKFYSELFHPLNKENGNVAIVLYEFPSNLSGKISLTEAVKMVTGISSGEQTKIDRFDTLKVGQWPDLGMPNGAYFLIYPSGTLFGINYTSNKDEVVKIFENMASSLTFMPAQ